MAPLQIDSGAASKLSGYKDREGCWHHCYVLQIPMLSASRAFLEGNLVAAEHVEVLERGRIVRGSCFCRCLSQFQSFPCPVQAGGNASWMSLYVENPVLHDDLTVANILDIATTVWPTQKAGGFQKIIADSNSYGCRESCWLPAGPTHVAGDGSGLLEACPRRPVLAARFGPRGKSRHPDFILGRRLTLLVRWCM